MVRPLRIEFPGARCDVTIQGDALQDIFLTDEDRQRFLVLSARTVSRFHFRLYAYCLMDNLFHLALETPEANLYDAMRQLNSVHRSRPSRIGPVMGLHYSTINRRVNSPQTEYA